MQLDEWHMFQITPFNREIQSIKMSPPLISQPTADSFPPGEAKGCKPLACTLYYSGRVRSSGCFLKSGITGGY